MSQTTAEAPRTRGPLNGVDTPTVFATINAVAGQRDLAAFRFRAVNRWQAGAHSRTSFTTFSGAGGEHEHQREFSIDSDHPAVLVGADQGPTPVEVMLGALAGCLTGGIANIAAARGIELYEVESVIEGKMDMQGIFGLSDEVRNGYESIRIDFRIKGDATDEQLQKVVEQSRARSAVFDMLVNPVPVTVTLDAA